MVASWADDPNGEAYKKHLARVKDYIWVGEDGMKIQVSITFYYYINIYFVQNIIHICMYMSRVPIANVGMFPSRYKPFLLLISTMNSPTHLKKGTTLSNNHMYNYFI